MTDRISHGRLHKGHAQDAVGACRFHSHRSANLVNYRGRRIANDCDNSTTLAQARVLQMHRILRSDSLCVSFSGWNTTDTFMTVWREAVSLSSAISSSGNGRRPVSFP